MKKKAEGIRALEIKKISMKHVFKKYNLKDVFTPSTVAKLTYVERKLVEGDLLKSLEIPGMQIVLYGHSGCGKTTLIMNKLAEKKYNRVKTSCTESTTFDQLILDVFDKLGSFYNSEKQRTQSSLISYKMKTKYKEIESSISSENSFSETEKMKRIAPVQLSAERLSEFLGAAQCVWVIEDFHKINKSEKTKLSQILKVFMDSASEYPKVKIVCIGAVGTARELIEYDRELSNRITENYIPLMNDDELKEIILKGFNFMNIYAEDDNLIQKIVHYSNNLASVCHQLCYDICYNKNIIKSGVIKQKICLSDFEESVKTYLRKVSDTFNSCYEKIRSRKDVKEILENILTIDKELFDAEEILKNKKNYPHEDKEKILLALSSVEFGEILRYNLTSKQFSFSNPFLQAFIKMKLAVERSEERAEKSGKQMELFNEKNQDSMMVFDYFDNNFKEYIEIMNNIMETRIYLSKNILRSDLKHTTPKRKTKQKNNYPKGKHK